MTPLRIMATPSTAAGHFYPMVPMLWALRSAGHDVRVVVPRFFASTVVQAGLPAVPTAPASEETALDPRDSISDDHTADTYRRIARVSRLMGPDVDRIAGEWRPDLVISDPMDYTGRRIAAERGVPHAEHGIGGFLLTAPRAKAAADVFGGEYRGWPGMGDVASVVIDPCPPSFQKPEAPPGVRVRYVPYNGPSLVPRWLTERKRGRRMLITMGTILSQGETGERLLREAVGATAGLDIEVVVSTGHGGLPEGLADGVRAVPWIPVGLAAHSCDLVVHHAGSGTTMSSLAHGVPQVVCPAILDQADNAKKLEELGAGRMVAPWSVLAGGGGLADAVQQVLGEPGYAKSAALLQAENDSAPSPARAAERLLRAVDERRGTWRV
ncbi:glycosyltransferase [Streptomyces sp. NPDC127033]|uniref:glycosyltransferase n=1 Tax=Streptomyces sp. NPDC127033 TaxID=3347110 RepID=UPI00365A9A60